LITKQFKRNYTSAWIISGDDSNYCQVIVFWVVTPCSKVLFYFAECTTVVRHPVHYCIVFNQNIVPVQVKRTAIDHIKSLYIFSKNRFVSVDSLLWHLLSVDDAVFTSKALRPPVSVIKVKSRRLW